MNKNRWKTIILAVIVFPLILMLGPWGTHADKNMNQSNLPSTGFEDRDGEEWTTQEEELSFLKEVEQQSDRVKISEIGKTIEGKPLHLVRIGFPKPPTDEEIKNGNNMLIAGSHHGNEPAGREMALKMIRDLAFTNDEQLLDQLSETTVLIIPTVNPDGRERNWRYNAERIDLNRDYLNLSTNVTQATAKIMGDFRPDIIIDAHERPSGSSPQMELAYSRNPNIDKELYDLSVDMVENSIIPYIEEGGFTAGIYGSEGRWLPDNMLGFRHSLDFVLESAGKEAPLDRVEMQMRTVEGIMTFYRDNFETITNTVAEAEERKMNADHFYLSVDDRLDEVPCGYLLHKTQAEKIKRHINILPLETEKIGEDGVFITMKQPMMTVIPLLMDERSAYNLVDGLALNTFDDLEAVEPPPPIEYTEPAQYSTDFSEYEVGSVPNDWTPIWKESSWTIKDNPRRLEHDIVGSGNGRRALTMDEVGKVYGDVEISSVVRAKNTGDTMFQIGFHMTGERTENISTENYYYLDIRKPDANGSANRVRINMVRDGKFKLLSSTVMPFTAQEDAWYNVVLQRDGDRLRAKIWEFGEEEPVAFQVSVSDPSFDYGLVGVTHFDSFAVNDYAFFGVGTGGEAAPRPPEDLFDPKVDKSELQELITEIEADDLKKADYTEGSWSAFEEAIERANAVLSSEGATQSEVDAALEALSATYEGLEKTDKTSKDALQEKVDKIKAEKLDASHYTDESWKAFQTALRISEELLIFDKIGDSIIDKALNNLELAYEELTEK